MAGVATAEGAVVAAGEEAKVVEVKAAAAPVAPTVAGKVAGVAGKVAGREEVEADEQT